MFWRRKQKESGSRGETGRARQVSGRSSKPLTQADLRAFLTLPEETEHTESANKKEPDTLSAVSEDLMQSPGQQATNTQYMRSVPEDHEISTDENEKSMSEAADSKKINDDQEAFINQLSAVLKEQADAPQKETNITQDDERDKDEITKPEKASGETKKQTRPVIARRQETSFERCLRVMLTELKWPGEARHLMQAMPHFRDLNDLPSFRGVAHHLGYETKVMDLSGVLAENRLPCIIVGRQGDPQVVLQQTSQGRFLIYNGKTDTEAEVALNLKSLQICVFEKPENNQFFYRHRKISWFYQGLGKFSNKILLVVGLTFVANLLALATPLFTMNVYNRVINSGSLDTLSYMLVAVLFTLVFEIYTRHMRGRLIAYIGSRFNTQLLIEGFKRILALPIGKTESASVSQQIVRLRQFENVQSFFTGPLVSAVLDLPFTIVFVIAISLIHPLLAIIPIALAGAFVLVGAISMPITKQNVTETGRARQRHQNLLIETVNKRESIRQLRGEDVWIKRWSDIGNRFNSLRFNAQFFDTIMHTLAQSLVMIAGVLTLWVGALLVIDEALSVGALIAVMMFVWRVLAPIQTAFLSLNRVGQFMETARQADLLMALPPEQQNNEAPTLRRRYQGNIVLQGVNFRYGNSGDPVFRGLSLRVRSGQVVAITGDPASGKSTLLKLILGLYRPQTGHVYLDGLNLQQLDLEEVRTSIGYVAQRQEFFYGTLAQNIRLASPSASDQEVEEALADAGIWLPHTQFEDGIETRLTGYKLSIMPNALKQSISLARAFVKKSNIYLLDTPTAYMNSFDEEELFDKIDNLRGNATVLVTTDNEALISKCDRVIFLKNGVVAFDDTPEVYLQAQALSSRKTA